MAHVKIDIGTEGRGVRFLKGSKWCMLGMGTADFSGLLFMKEKTWELGCPMLLNSRAGLVDTGVNLHRWL